MPLVWLGKKPEVLFTSITVLPDQMEPLCDAAMAIGSLAQEYRSCEVE